MATMNANEVGVGAARATGAIYVAPNGTAAPTDAVTPIDASVYTLLGFTSDAGMTISESRSTNSISAWEGRTTVYEVVTEYTESVAFTPIQVNADVAKLIWGEGHVSVDESGNFIVEHHGETLEPVEIVIETVPRPSIIRRYAGTFQLSERGDSANDGTQVDGRQLTFKAIADESGVTMREFIAYTAAQSDEQPEVTPGEGE